MYIISHLKDVKAKASDHKGDKFIVLYDKGSMMSVEQHLLLSAPNVEFLNFSDYPSAEAAIWFTIGRHCNAKEEAAIIGHVPYDIEKCPAWPGIHYFESMDDLYAKPQPKKKTVKKAPAKTPEKDGDAPKADAGKEQKAAPAGEQKDAGKAVKKDTAAGQETAEADFRKLLEELGLQTDDWNYILAGIQKASSVYSLTQCVGMHLVDKDQAADICGKLKPEYKKLREAALRCPVHKEVKGAKA